VWNFLTVCLADEHIKETKFPCNDKTGQKTKSVARSSCGYEIASAKNTEWLQSNARYLKVRPNFANALLAAVC